MSFKVEKPGMFTIVQDLGRWGHQFRGVTVSGPMDPFSLRMGNVMLGNDQNDAALEAAMFGLEITIQSECCVAVTGADLGLRINGSPAAMWAVHYVTPGTRLALTALTGDGCRAYVCFSGGIDVPVVMGSRSTFTRAKLGGFHGRKLAAGDVLPLRDPCPLWRRSAGFVCPPELRPARNKNEPLDTMDGPQLDAFSEKGVETFYSETYTVTNEIDRMGYRLTGPEIERVKPPDIVSDGIVWGSVQVQGQNLPIVMMSDRQTTGGYTKIAVVCAWSMAQLAQRLPGETARFRRVTEKEAAERLIRFEEELRTLDAMRATYRSR
jgi:biotin-dependent carboxylase-like uncharacterized protein